MSKAAPAASKSRYQLKGVLGKGGMGTVYRAYDTTTEREVSLKTLNDVTDKASLDLFKAEYSRQKSLTHPNIVDIFDIGELEHDGERRPYFTMPLLRGCTLDDLIRNSSHRMTVERAVDIACQVCRGLQAAHDAGLVHRDIKPGNIFVMEDDAVKILDFGISHLVDKNSTMGLKGTLMYMSPEQIRSQKPTPLSDIFSLAVVCYESLTRKKPFEGETREEAIQAILNRVPPPACELNPGINWPLSQVLHAALAKEPWRRFSSAKEFSEALQKALRGEPVERFDPTRIQPRLERARKACQENEWDYAADILAELESECWIDPEIVRLRREVDGVRREQEIRRHLEAASLRIKDEDYPLALQKIEEILRLDPKHPEALRLRDTVQTQHRSKKIDGWFGLARRHIENHAYDQARQALQNVLQINPNDSMAKRLLGDIDKQEQEHHRQRQLKEQLYDSALQDWQRGEVTNALAKLERLLAVDRTSAEHQSLYNQVRSAHDQLKSTHQEVRQHLENRNFRAALQLCNEALAKYPQNTLFQALHFDAEAGQRQELSEYIAQVDRDVDKEPDVDRKVGILEAALERFPVEHFRQSLNLVRAKRDLVNSILEKARAFEANGQLSEALGQLEILRNIASQHPGLAFEVERLQRRRDQHTRSEAKIRWVDQIDRCLGLGEYTRALELTEQALADFADDAELRALETLARQGVGRSLEAQVEFERSKESLRAGHNEAGVQAMRRAYELDERNTRIRAALVEQLLVRSRAVLDTDWRSSESFVEEALRLDPGNPGAKSLRLMVKDHERAECMDECLSRARACQAGGDIAGALAHLDRALAEYPTEPRLMQLRSTLEALGAQPRPQPEKRPFQENPPVPLPPEPDPSIGVPQRASPPATAPPPELVEHTLPSPPPAPAVEPVAPGPPKPVAPSAPKPPAEWQQAVARSLMTVGAGVLVAALWVSSKIAAVGRMRPRTLMVAAGGLVLIAASALVLMKLFRPAAPPPAELVQVRVETSPPGAALYINGEGRDASSPIELKPGDYKFKAVLEGYLDAEQTVSVSPVSRGAIQLLLTPLPPVVRITGDLNQGQVLLENEPPRELLDGELTLDGLSEGKRTLKVASQENMEVSIGFETLPGKAPQLVGPLAPKEMQAVVVVSYLGKARVYCSFAPAKLAVGDRQLGEVPPEGLELSLKPGAVHTLLFGEGKSQRAFPVEIGAAPSLIMALSSDRNVGHLEIAANEQGFRLFIDDKERKYASRDGKYYVRGLEAKTHTVRIELDGYTVEPQQHPPVEVQKGRNSTATFELRTIPVQATLNITGAPPGAEITFNGATHRIGNDGSLTVKVNAGKHKLGVRMPDHTPWEREYEFAEGKTIEISGRDITLERIIRNGTVEVRLEPASAHATYRLASGGPERPVPGTKFELTEGKYVFKATAPDHTDSELTVDVARGTAVTVPLRPRPIVRAAVKVDRWEQPWRQEKEWLVRKGGNNVLYSAQPPIGSFTFTVARTKAFLSTPHIRWIFNYKDDRNYEEFDIDPDNLTWRRVSDGREALKKSGKHRVQIRNHIYVIQMQIQAAAVTQTIVDGTGFTPLPNLRPPDAGPIDGKFGFRIGGDEELFLQGFKYSPATR